jgi:hypothetical protein
MRIGEKRIERLRGKKIIENCVRYYMGVKKSQEKYKYQSWEGSRSLKSVKFKKQDDSKTIILRHLVKSAAGDDNS